MSAPRVGLCGFTINAAEYFATFDTLEVQQTFYEPPSKLTMTRWREQAPAGFVFTIKAWQVITHRSTSLPAEARETYVMFNNIPRVGDARRFMARL